MGNIVDQLNKVLELKQDIVAAVNNRNGSSISGDIPFTEIQNHVKSVKSKGFKPDDAWQVKVADATEDDIAIGIAVYEDYTFNLGTLSGIKAVVYWGDDTLDVYEDGDFMSHSYSVADSVLPEIENGYKQFLIDIKTYPNISIAPSTDNEDAFAFVTYVTGDLGIFITALKARYFYSDKAIIFEDGNTQTFKNSTSENIVASILVAAESIAQAFSGSKELVRAPFLDLSKVTNANSLFQSCINMTSVPAYDFSNLAEVHGMFASCKLLAEGIREIDLPKATRASYFVQDCDSLQILGNINLPLAITTSHFAQECKALVAVGDVYMPKTTDCSYFFASNKKLISIGQVTIPTDPHIDVKADFMLGALSEVTYIPPFDGTRIKNASHILYNCPKLIVNPITFDWDGLTDMTNMFYNCQAMTDFKFPESGMIDCSNKTSMYGAFAYCQSLDLDLLPTFINTEAITRVTYLYKGLKFPIAPATPKITSSVTSSDGMYADNPELVTIGYAIDLSGSTSRHAYISGLVQGCTKLENISFVPKSIYGAMNFGQCYKLSFESINSILEGLIDLTDFPERDWDHRITFPNVSSLKNANLVTEEMVRMITDKGWIQSGLVPIAIELDALKRLIAKGDDVTTVDTSKITDMSGLFKDMTDFNQDISGWDVSSVTDMSDLFNGCTSFDQDITSWTIASVTNLDRMFSGCTSFTHSLEDWIIKDGVTYVDMTLNSGIAVEDLAYLYTSGTPVTREELEVMITAGDPIEKVNTINITDMSDLFKDNETFNQNIGYWNVSNVTDMSSMFDNAKLFNQAVGAWDVSNVTDMSRMFYHAEVFDTHLNNWDVSNVTDITSMFDQAYVFNGDVSTWDVSNITDMTNMFYRAQQFNQDISGWDVSNVTTMSELFNGAQQFNADISGWDVSNVTNMTGLFIGNASFNRDISTWDVSNVTTMKSMFRSTNVFNQDISTWDVSSVTNMSYMFYSTQMFNQDISAWDVSNVTDMSYLIANSKMFNQPLEDWDVSSVTTLSWMLYNTVAFNQPLANWDIYSVENFSYMLYNNSTYTQDLSSWEVNYTANLNSMYSNTTIPAALHPSIKPESVTLLELQTMIANEEDVTEVNIAGITNMSGLFKDNTTFNQDISGWDVREINNTSEMFLNATAFNQDISAWALDETYVVDMYTGCSIEEANKAVPNLVLSIRRASRSELKELILANDPIVSTIDISGISDMSQMFQSATGFDQDISGWDVSHVTNMTGMFISNGSFNQDISGWDVSNVTNMTQMFQNNSMFNQDISGWDVSNVTDMHNMFQSAEAFDQDISIWDVSKVTSMSYMFYGTTYNQPLNSWDVSSVTNFQMMFGANTGINQDLNSWDVSNATTMHYMFYQAAAFNGNISAWDVSNAVNMGVMFDGCASFNQDIGAWNVSNATSMAHMMRSCTSFNQDISAWDVSNLTSAYNLFSGCTVFNQDISSWTLPSTCNVTTMYVNCPIEEAYKAFPAA